jgi:hypothetical protein
MGPFFQPSVFKRIFKRFGFWHIFCFCPDCSKRTEPDSGRPPGPQKKRKNQEGNQMIQRENNRHSRHKAPKFKETQEEDLCWEDRRELHNHRKSDKKPYQKNRTRQKW